MRLNLLAVSRIRLAFISCLVLLPTASLRAGPEEEEHETEQAALSALKKIMEVRRGNPYGGFLNPDVVETHNADNEGARKADQPIISLSMNCTYFGDRDVQHVLALTRLRALWLLGTDITDAGLRELSKHQAIECLILSYTNVTDDGLANLGQMGNLKVLWIGDTKITDSGMRDMASLKSLVSLDITNTGVTPVGLSHLRALENLRVICAGKDQFDKASMASFQKAVPKVRFHIDGR